MIGVPAAFALGITLSLCVSAQQARDTTSAPQPGTARLSGQVVTMGDNPRPLRRVIVTVTGDGLKDGRTTITDDKGQFAFEGLPAGRFNITGTRPAYLPGAYGAEQPGHAGVSLVLTSGEVRTDAGFVMARGAVLAGALHTERGEPAANVEVAAFRMPAPATDWWLVLSGSTMTDDRGRYRLFELPPGDYYVVAAIRRRLAATGEATRWTTAQMDAALRDLKQDLKREAVPAVAPTEATFAYAPVYYPGSASAATAGSIRLAAEEERTGVDFTVALTRLATIEGSLVGGPDVAQAQFFFTAVGVQLPSLLGNTPTFSSQAAAGARTFKYSGVVPGRYTITAHVPGADTTWARADVSVAEGDVAGLSLVLQPAWRMSGRVVFETASAALRPTPSAVSLRAMPANGLNQSSSGGTRMGNPLVPPARVGSDGRFEMSGLLSDTYRLVASVSGAPGLRLRSATLNGRDVLDHELTINSDLSDVVLTFSDVQTSLSGRIITDDGPPRRSLFVLAFPSDASLWRPQSRRIAAARTDTEGRWMMRDLPAGEYRLAVVTDLVAGELSDPSFLRRMTPASIAVTLADGEHKTQDLRMGLVTVPNSTLPMGLPR